MPLATACFAFHDDQARFVKKKFASPQATMIFFGRTADGDPGTHAASLGGGLAAPALAARIAVRITASRPTRLNVRARYLVR
jgi:hypothetical protein